MKILIFESYPTNFSREKIALEELGHSVTLFNPYLHKKNYKNKLKAKQVVYQDKNLFG